MAHYLVTLEIVTLIKRQVQVEADSADQALIQAKAEEGIDGDIRKVLTSRVAALGEVEDGEIPSAA